VARVSIACSLSAGDASLRGVEWHRFLETRVVETRRSKAGVQLRLKDDAAVLAAIDLARREKACCAFFDFRLELLPEAVWLEVRAPEDAALILDALFAPSQPSLDDQRY
jgi:hypothetical protein